MRLMLASRLPSYGSMFKLCTYPLTCVFICIQVHWLESLLMSSCKMDRGASPLLRQRATFESHQKVAMLLTLLKSSKLSFLELYTKIISKHNGFVKEQSLLQEMTVLHTLTTSCWMTFQVM